MSFTSSRSPVRLTGQDCDLDAFRTLTGRTTGHPFPTDPDSDPPVGGRTPADGQRP
ncbi:hypothetical protein [Streptomyces asoensis]|uniref:hypothetical protein n=1 Tax=Streptomyces asoensis TaxID=249586 RepID=UPI0033C633FA